MSATTVPSPLRVVGTSPTRRAGSRTLGIALLALGTGLALGGGALLVHGLRTRRA